MLSRRARSSRDRIEATEEVPTLEYTQLEN